MNSQSLYNQSLLLGELADQFSFCYWERVPLVPLGMYSWLAADFYIHCGFLLSPYDCTRILDLCGLYQIFNSTITRGGSQNMTQWLEFINWSLVGLLELCSECNLKPHLTELPVIAELDPTISILGEAMFSSVCLEINSLTSLICCVYEQQSKHSLGCYWKLLIWECLIVLHIKTLFSWPTLLCCSLSPGYYPNHL